MPAPVPAPVPAPAAPTVTVTVTAPAAAPTAAPGTAPWTYAPQPVAPPAGVAGAAGSAGTATNPAATSFAIPGINMNVLVGALIGLLVVVVLWSAVGRAAKTNKSDYRKTADWTASQVMIALVVGLFLYGGIWVVTGGFGTGASALFSR